jgi:hypothetical protein
MVASFMIVRPASPARCRRSSASFVSGNGAVIVIGVCFPATTAAEKASPEPKIAHQRAASEAQARFLV